MWSFGKKADSPVVPVETKVERPFKPILLSSDDDTIMHLDAMMKEPQVEIELDLNPDTGYTIANPDGSISWIAECVTVNGIQFQIPANQRVKLPKSVYEFLMACPHQKHHVRFTMATGPLSLEPTLKMLGRR